MAAVHEEAAGSQWLPDMDSVKQELERQDPTVLSVAVALLAVLVALLLWKVLRRSQSSRRAVLLVGLCDSGKTLLFSRLLTGKYMKTQTSMSPNTALYRVKREKGSSFTLVDVPGYESSRVQFMEQYKPAARALVFLVDSSAFQRDLKEVAEFLYQILTDATIVRNAPPILIACNKQDISTAKSAKLIQQQLEKELHVSDVDFPEALKVVLNCPGKAQCLSDASEKDGTHSESLSQPLPALWTAAVPPRSHSWGRRAKTLTSPNFL